jgi:hypothetical protein
MDAADRTAVALFQSLYAGDWTASREAFSPRFRAALSEAELAAIWRQVTGPLGSLESATVIDRAMYGELEVRVVSLVFAKGTAVGRVSFQTSTGLVEGLVLEPPAPPS